MVFKCKMCGAPLNLREGQSFAFCGYCGTKQTIPRLSTTEREQLYDRANHFRRANEFDKAMRIYEKILLGDSSDCEAYWSIALCKYGVEYVKDPSSGTMVPTVNRTQLVPLSSDDDYKNALRYADNSQKEIYKQQAELIDNIQRNILKISQNEKPFDIFICYKESDENGKRTYDSVIAADMYTQLTKIGYKVFFSRITLEDKMGTAYEPYIYAALKSAKIMIVLGTRPEFFNAVWVKNEWGRYLKLIQAGEEKTLIPAYRDMDPYLLPEEFAYLHALDMGRLGFMQDLVRGIQKIVPLPAPEPDPGPVPDPIPDPAPPKSNAGLIAGIVLALAAVAAVIAITAAVLNSATDSTRSSDKSDDYSSGDVSDSFSYSDKDNDYDYEYESDPFSSTSSYKEEDSSYRKDFSHYGFTIKLPDGLVWSDGSGTGTLVFYEEYNYNKSLDDDYGSGMGELFTIQKISSYDEMSSINYGTNVYYIGETNKGYALCYFTPTDVRWYSDSTSERKYKEMQSRIDDIIDTIEFVD